MMNKNTTENWNDSKICRAATGWPLSDIDQLDDKSCFAEQKRIVDFNLDGKKLVDTIASAGAEVFCFHAKSHSGNVWFNSKVARKFSALGERDLVEEIVSECKRRGISTIGMVQIVCDRRAHDEHPEWRQINSEGEYCKVSPRVCFNNPGYREYILAIMDELAGTCGFDAIMVDEFDFNGRYGGGQMCYCEHCRKLFHQHFSCEMPVKEDWGNPEWKKFIRFRFDSLGKFIKEVRDRIKKVNPDIMLTIVSYSGYNLTWQRLQPVEIFSEYLDFFCLDIYGDISSSCYSRFFRAYSRKKGEIMAGVSPLLAHFAKEPLIPNLSRLEILSDAMTVVANNLSWNIDIGYKPLPVDHVIDPSIMADYKYITGEISKRQEWLTGKQKSLAEVALYYSEDSKIFYGKNSPRLYTDEFMGYFKALLESHKVFDIVGAKHLNAEDLKQYRLLIIPNAACLSDAQLAEIRKFSADGGAVLASYKTSLFDENGNQRKDFGLGSCLGIEFTSDAPGGDYSPEQLVDAQRKSTEKIEYGYMKMKKEGVLSAGVEDITALFTSSVIIKPGANTECAGEFFRRKKSASNHIPGFNESYAPDTKAESLAVLQSGNQGRKVYFTPKLGSLYWKLGFNYAGRIIKNAVEWLLDGKESIKVTAPESVEVTAFMQGEKRMIIHFVNNQTAPQKVAMNELYDPRFNETEAMLPVYDLAVEFNLPKGKKIEKTYLAPEMDILEIEVLPDDRFKVVIPKLEIHSMLVIETIRK